PCRKMTTGSGRVPAGRNTAAYICVPAGPGKCTHSAPPTAAPPNGGSVFVHCGFGVLAVVTPAATVAPAPSGVCAPALEVPSVVEARALIVALALAAGVAVLPGEAEGGALHATSVRATRIRRIRCCTARSMDAAWSESTAGQRRAQRSRMLRSV